MTRFIDETKWRQLATQEDWYLQLEPDYRALLQTAERSDAATKEKIKSEIYSLTEELLADGTLYIGREGEDFDQERAELDTVVIHHTSSAAGMSLARLNAIHLLRLYAAHYAHPPAAESQIKGRPIYSGHFKADRPVFYAYHWLIREDGSCERLLEDNEIGWHAGNWQVNCRSVAVCFDADLSQARPSVAALQSVADLLQTNYPSCQLVGHREVNPQTDCPGELFLSDWKRQLEAHK
ncbi:MAG: peptidoglycan recognition family protein [Candidatus Saccharimonadales bacterium]